MLLRFVSHNTSEKLAASCAARGVPCAHVEHGYGVAAIRRTLEERRPRSCATTAAK